MNTLRRGSKLIRLIQKADDVTKALLCKHVVKYLKKGILQTRDTSETSDCWRLIEEKFGLNYQTAAVK
jgi:hypothetical protein